MKCITFLTAVACAALPVVGADVPTDFQSPFLAIGLSRSAPAFARFSVDSLGQGKTSFNPVLDEGTNLPTLHLAAGGTNRFLYSTRSPDSGAAPAWSIECGEQKLRLRSQFQPGGDPVPPFALAFNQKSNHATLLGLIRPGQRQMPLPCVLHLPDMGSVRITATVPGWHLDYDARRYVKTPFVRVAFPSATSAQPEVEYHLEVVAIHPPLAGIETNALFDGFRRDYLNLFQINPRVQMLANNASSDPVPFTLFNYAKRRAGFSIRCWRATLPASSRASATQASRRTGGIGRVGVTAMRACWSTTTCRCWWCLTSGGRRDRDDQAASEEIAFKSIVLSAAKSG